MWQLSEMAIIRRSAAEYLKNAIAQAQTGVSKDTTAAAATTPAPAPATRPPPVVR